VIADAGKTPTIRARRALLGAIAATALVVGGVAGAAAGGGTEAPSEIPIPVGRAVGQMLITGFEGTAAPATLLQRIRDGHVGGVVLFAGNTAGGQTQIKRLIASLQSAAASGHQPGLLVMADQEGGAIRRLPGPPKYPASQMTSASRARAQGLATGRYLLSMGVNVDLAPVADVRRRTNGFLALDHRTFGSTAPEVALRACAFAQGLRSAGVGATFKHFPGLGTALTSTDAGPVTVRASAAAIRADEEAYRECVDGTKAPSLVMVSSASYPQLTGGDLPAVLSPEIYRTELPVDHVTAPTISDDLGAGALDKLPAAATDAVNAGLDLLLYASDGSRAGHAFATLVREARSGAISPARVQAAATSVLALKHGLGLPDS
jgi:beta-N-acetylhexosaminidase